MTQYFTAPKTPSGMKVCALSAIFASALAVTACGGGSTGSSTNAPDTMPSGATGSGSISSNGSGSGTGTGTTATDLGPRCAASATGAKYCIGLKYVVFEDSTGAPSANQATVVANVAAMNAIWSTCSVNFQLENYQEANPTTDNLSANGDTSAEMNAMRTAFADTNQFLIVSLWGTVAGADAWTEEAGSGSPYGTILDYNVVTYTPVIAHEMGHYMGLEHVTDSTNLMYPSPYPNPTLTSAQCATVVSTIQSEWTAMLR